MPGKNLIAIVRRGRGKRPLYLADNAKLGEVTTPKLELAMTYDKRHSASKFLQRHPKIKKRYTWSRVADRAKPARVTANS